MRNKKKIYTKKRKKCYNTIERGVPMQDYKFIIIPIISLVLCQILKFIIESIQKRKLIWGRLFNGAGGMPSTHTSFCFALTFTLGYQLGFSSPFFAIAQVFSMIVSYDAMGVRMESGKQAEAINDIVDSVFKNKKKLTIAHLKEELGHEPIEVFVGVIFAFVISTLCNFYLF